MYAVEIDQTKRLVVISVVKHVTGPEAQLAAKELREKLFGASPGFDVLVDLRWLDRMDGDAAHYIGEIMDILAEKKVRSVTRVIPDPHKDIGLSILSQFHYGPEIEIATYENFAEAVQSLRGETGTS
jgi:anti-anti-sigma regulatory factor